ALVAVDGELGRASRRLVAGGLDLGALVPLVVARDRHAVRLRVDRRPPHRVVGLAVAAGLEPLVPRRPPGLVTRADRRQAQKMGAMGLLAESREVAAAEAEDVVGVDPVEVRGGGMADEPRL